MIGDHHGQTAGSATLLVRAMDGILGTHKVSAQAGYFRHCGVAWIIQARASRQAYQQCSSLFLCQGVKADCLGVVQRGQVSTAGDQHQAPGGSWQERADLLAIGRVIE
jgi:hypothetical protein